MKNVNTPPTPAGTSVERPASTRDLIIGNLYVFIATLFFGINIPVVKMLIPHWMTANDVTLFRVFGGTILMWLASIFLPVTSIARGDRWRVFWGGILLFAFMMPLNLALRYANPINVAIIQTFPPVFVILIGVLFQHRRPGWAEWIGIYVSLVGAMVVILLQPGRASDPGSNELLGDLLALASAVFYAIYLVVLEGPSHTYRPVSLMRWVFLASCLPAVFFIPALTGADIFHTTRSLPWLLITFTMVCPTFLSYFLEAPAIKKIGSELVSLYQYLIPVVAAIASVVVGIAHIELMQIVAMVVIIAGMVLTDVGKRRRLIRATRS